MNADVSWLQWIMEVIEVAEGGEKERETAMELGP
jgi:hypothetical protein